MPAALEGSRGAGLRRIRRTVAWISATSILVACGSDATGPGGVNLAFNPGSPGSAFVPAATFEEQAALADEIWAALSAPACWDASAIVQSSQPVGIVSQFQFYSGSLYRHYGFEVFTGAVLLHQVGRYEGFLTAIVETWTGEVEALIVLSGQEIAHVYPHLNGSIIVLRYGRSNGPCL